jgi:TetR/AcrR family transcriptional regulator
MLNKASAPGTGTRRRRTRGRPRTGAEDVRQALLAAARDLFLRYGYRAVSSRQIAAAAGANVAMIRYYFGGKSGLYRQMLQEVFTPVRERLEALLSTHAPIEISDVLATAVRTVASNPWIAGFVVREVLTPEGPLRGLFLREGPERLAPLVERLIQGEIDAGKVRADLDAKLAVLSMISLALFPFLAFPVTSRVFGVRTDEEFIRRFLRHTQQLLAHGVGGHAK